MWTTFFTVKIFSSTKTRVFLLFFFLTFVFVFLFVPFFFKTPFVAMREI